MSGGQGTTPPAGQVAGVPSADYRRAVTRGLRTAVFLLRIIVPLSLAVSLMDWIGLLRWIGGMLGPAMTHWGLPGESAVVLVSGWLVGIYGAVASMSILPLTGAQVTILSIWSLTAHNLIVECGVQHRTGTPWWIMFLVRMIAGAALAWVAAMFLSGGDSASVAIGQGGSSSGDAAVSARPALDAFLLHWGRSTLELAAKILVILIGLMLVTESMRARDLYRKLARPLRPLLRALGLDESVAFLWITAIVLGLAYGSGLLMEDAREPGRYRPRDLRDLNVSIGVCHSVLEDTALLVACGASLLWITVPRFVTAALAVRLIRWISPAPKPAT